MSKAITNLFRKKEERSYQIPEYLNSKDKRKVAEIIRNAQGGDGVPWTTQQSIPLDWMFQDGTCRVGTDYYTKTVRSQDINYQPVQQEDRTEIFEEWCSSFSLLDSSVHFEPSFINLATDSEKFEKSIAITHRDDGFDEVEDEYTGVLRRQMEAGNNGLTRTKYLTSGIHTKPIKIAKLRLVHIEMDLLGNFKRLGVQAETLDGRERLEFIHQEFHMGDGRKFSFDWRWLIPSSLPAEDFIVPLSLSFKNGKVFQMGELWCAMSFLSVIASDIGSRMLADLLSMEPTQIVTMYTQSADQAEATKTVEHAITGLDRSKTKEQKKAMRSGYDMGIIPSDLATYGNNAKALLKELQSQDERMFLLTFPALNTGRIRQELENNVSQVNSIVQRHNCSLVRLDFQQEQGLMSSLPLAHNEIKTQRGMTTSSIVIFVPPTTRELFQPGKETLYYGLDALPSNLIMVDRKLLKNPNGLILNTPGPGKSFAAEREIANALLVTDDDIVISDPEAEYSTLVQRLGGQAIKITPTSEQYINPMDIDMNYSDDGNPIALKTNFILSLCELIVDGREGLKPVEKTVIDRCTHRIYNYRFEDLGPEKMSLSEDLYVALLKQEEPEVKNVAAALEIHVTGPLSIFNHRTNMDINNRLVYYDIKDPGEQLKEIGILVVQDVRFVSC